VTPEPIAAPVDPLTSPAALDVPLEPVAAPVDPLFSPLALDVTRSRGRRSSAIATRFWAWGSSPRRLARASPPTSAPSHRCTGR